MLRTKPLEAIQLKLYPIVGLETERLLDDLHDLVHSGCVFHGQFHVPVAPTAKAGDIPADAFEMEHF